MQPPPRKGNYTKFLKNLHTEQINKLVLKNQHECDLLEDIRTFTTKKCALEKSYSDALLKISSAYLNKKIPNIPDIKIDGGEEKWNMWNVWRTVLEENEKLARARLAAVEVFQQQIAEDSKLLRAHKIHAARKCVEQLATVQKELQTCVQDIDKTKKLYFDEEHSAHDVRDKARDIEEKLKKKKGSFFQSITSLQKNSAKVSSKREQLEEKSAGARNDYLLCLAAANAHQTRYFVIDLQLCMTTMESGVYEKVAEYILLMGRTELLTCSAMQNSYSKIRDQAKQLTREYNLQCCYLYYPVLKQHIQYEFEPCDNDPILTVAAEHDSAAATLAKEARRYASKIARENALIKESIRKLQIYNALRESGQKTDPNDPNGPDLETRIEDLKQEIRKAETAKLKSEARIECLKAGGVQVDGLLQEAELLSVQGIQRSASSLSFRTDGEHLSSDSFYDSDFADGEVPATTTAPAVDHADSEESQADQNSEIAEVDAILENERQRIEQLTAGWDDPTEVDWGTEGETIDDNADEAFVNREGSYLKCTALYSYTAQNPDELTIVENEQLEVVGDGDGDGWLKARNYRGEEGFVPHNYLDIDKETSATTPGSGLQQQISFSSVDYTVATNGTEDFYAGDAMPGDQVEPFAAFDSVRTESVDETKSSAITVLPSRTVSYCIALYDYEGQGDEELSFEEGSIIKVLSKCAHSIDDGWWQGQLEDRIGNFPSLVVEECDEYGEPITSDLDGTPPLSAPPVFTPPEPEPHLVEEYLFDEEQDVPETFPPSAAPPPAEAPPILDEPTASSKSKGFSIELSHNQQKQYGSQFDNKNDEMNNPSVSIADKEHQNVEKKKKRSDDLGLGVAQIVITAATPMIEDGDHVFPIPEEEEEEPPEEEEIHTEPEKPVVDNQVHRTESTEEKPRTEQEDVTTDSAQYVISSSTGSDGDTTGPSTAENSVSQVVLYSEPEADCSAPKQLVGGRASIPDELELHQLERLQNLRESNA